MACADANPHRLFKIKAHFKTDRIASLGAASDLIKIQRFLRF